MKRIIRLTENDLTRLVKRVINEQMNISQVPYKKSVNVNGKTLTSGEKILIHNDDSNFNYYGTIDEIELNDGQLTLTVNGGVVYSVEVDTAIERKNEPIGEVMFGRNCLKVTIPEPIYIDKVYFGKNVHTLNFSKLNLNYLRSSESACVSETQNEKLKNLGIRTIR